MRSKEVMIRSELVTRILNKKPDLYRHQAETAVDAVLNAIEQALCRSRRVELRGFGVFAAKRRRQKEGYNPRTGGTVAIPEKLYPVFRPGKETLQRLNGQSVTLPSIS
jgi:integration host factor subunit beta